jgi:NAD(P)-dependent dehydrogenase (short-subunit alcohol dehydrogenase family)
MIQFDLKDRVAVVTGGAQGFGLAITERFIESGAKVVIWDIDENEAKKALEKVNSKNLTYQIVDVSNIETINDKLSEIKYCLNCWKRRQS